MTVSEAKKLVLSHYPNAYETWRHSPFRQKRVYTIENGEGKSLGSGGTPAWAWIFAGQAIESKIRLNLKYSSRFWDT